jgi:Family of unknown function (DUF6101)
MWATTGLFNPRRGSPCGAETANCMRRGNRSSIMGDLWPGRYVRLTSVLKPITTASWQRGGDRAATARREPSFRGVKMEAGRFAAWSSRVPRLDPFSLPVRFEAADEAADGRRRVIDLHRERVVVRRSVHGMRMALNLPVAAFRGVAIRLAGAANGPPTSIAVVLEHGDPALSLPLFSSSTGDDIVAEWQSWGRVLGLPLLIVEPDGCVREPFARLGAVRIEAPTWRRRRRSAIALRRPSILLRRRAGVPSETPTQHRGEREIIARD